MKRDGSHHEQSMICVSARPRKSGCDAPLFPFSCWADVCRKFGGRSLVGAGADLRWATPDPDAAVGWPARRRSTRKQA